MIITLPDSSQVSLNTKTGQMRRLNGTHSQKPRPTTNSRKLHEAVELMARNLQRPSLPFQECFRRICDTPCYSPIRAKRDFNVKLITRFYNFKGHYRGGTFCSSDTNWRFLDGGIFEHNGYGWGSHSWTVVEGIEALRAVCMFCGIQQPLRIKGEGPRRPLSVLLQEIFSTHQEAKASGTKLPIWP
jgi:hypothetical protein